MEPALEETAIILGIWRRDCRPYDVDGSLDYIRYPDRPKDYPMRLSTKEEERRSLGMRRANTLASYSLSIKGKRKKTMVTSELCPLEEKTSL